MPLRIAGPAAARCARRTVASRPREKELLITAMSPAFHRRGGIAEDLAVFIAELAKGIVTRKAETPTGRVGAIRNGEAR